MSLFVSFAKKKQQKTNKCVDHSDWKGKKIKSKKENRKNRENTKSKEENGNNEKKIKSKSYILYLKILKKKKNY